MKKRGKIVSRFIAGALAATMVLGSGVTNFGNEVGDVYAETVYASVEINATNFPDVNFKNVIKESFDKDNNNILDNDELQVARNIHCDKRGISDLKGIELLPELRGLYCTENNIGDGGMDLSQNKLITGVWCSDNNFTSLDFSANPNLEWVYCYNCDLTYLNVADNPKLSYLECSTNPRLGSIDVSKNPLLEHLICFSCGLTSVDFSNNPKLQHLDIQLNDLTSLDLSHNTLMKRLDFWGNENLGYVDISMLPGLQYYNCAQTGITTLDMSGHPELTKLNCGWNDITSLNVSNNPKLEYLACNDNAITNLDVSNNPKLNFLQAHFNNFTSLKICNCPYIAQTYFEGTKETVTISGRVTDSSEWTINLGGKDVNGLDNIYFLSADNKVAIDTTGYSGTPSTVSYDDSITDASNQISREMVIQTLYDMEGRPSVAGLTNKYTDVKEGSWYYDAMLWAQNNEICQGYPDPASHTFGIGKVLTRQDLAVILYLYAQYKGYDSALDFGRTDEFIDYYEIDNYAWEGLTWTITHNIGVDDPYQARSEQYIRPHGKVTRSELAQFIADMLEANGGYIARENVPIPDQSLLQISLSELAAREATTGGDSTGGGSSDGSSSGGSGSGYSNQWVQENGDYYFYDEKGQKETNCYRNGCWLDSEGKYNPSYANGTWKCNSIGWWYEDGSWYPSAQWLKIDGKWYYFLSSGYMDYGEYRDGCWLNSDGSWEEGYSSGTWHVNSTGWWYTDGSWYPVNQYLWIDGTRYHFNASGYWDK